MKKIFKRTAQTAIIGVPLLYFLPKFFLFYVVCGIYDVTRNKNLSLSLLDKYFYGNGVPTWILSPFNILMDIVTLPYVNKGVYRLEDLPAQYQAEIKQVIESAHRHDLVRQLQSRAETLTRSMFFFKWYGANVDNIATIPAFHQTYRYIKTIGVSVFNKKESTSKHFGPVRCTLRVLYNVNTMEDDSAYIVVGDVTNYWRENKLFIFDDTLLHQSFNESDKVRYCLFIDIVRPSILPGLLTFFVNINRFLFKGANSMFYDKWKIVGK